MVSGQAEVGDEAGGEQKGKEMKRKLINEKGQWVLEREEQWGFLGRLWPRPGMFFFFSLCLFLSLLLTLPTPTLRTARLTGKKRPPNPRRRPLPPSHLPCYQGPDQQHGHPRRGSGYEKCCVAV